jgi:toxin ParE1/3/4
MIQRLEVDYQESATNDLANIFSYIVEAGGSVDAALGFVLRIEDRCRTIGNAPRGGRLRNDVMPGLRTVPFEHSAVIAYVIEGDKILIVNVFYGGRDFEALMRGNASQ